jgi:hypothetical protein
MQALLGCPLKATYVRLVRLRLEAGFMYFKNGKALYLMHMHIPVRSIGGRVDNIPSSELLDAAAFALPGIFLCANNISRSIFFRYPVF